MALSYFEAGQKFMELPTPAKMREISNAMAFGKALDSGAPIYEGNNGVRVDNWHYCRLCRMHMPAADAGNPQAHLVGCGMFD